MENDRTLFLSLSSVLVGFGVLMVHSASVTSWPTEFEQVYLSRHCLFLLIGGCAGYACSRLPGEFWQRWAPAIFLISLTLLAIVLIPGVGTRIKGAQRWLRCGSASLQPAELAKIALPLFVCRVMMRRRDRIRHWFLGTVPVAIPAGLAIALVFLQPDLGTALFLAVSCGLVLFLGGWPIRNFVLAGGLAAYGGLSLGLLREYQIKRITGFLAAWSDFSQAPYQLKQSLVSLGSGGLYGVGLGKGWQKLSFLPEANTDFVFAVVGEELGGIGTLALVAVWISLFFAGLRLLRHLPRDSFAFVMGVTLLTQLVLQAALNVAVVTAMVPPKGIPHPLISYGGSSLVVSMVSIGMILGLSRSSDVDEEMESVPLSAG